MIDVHGLVKGYGSGRILDGVDASVAEGEIVSIVGASGSGKSTLLRCLNGLEEFEAGSIAIAGFELRSGPHSTAELRRLRSAVGMVFQDFQLFPHMTVLENITLAPRVVRGVEASLAEREARGLLARVGLADRVGARPAELSGGQKQRVAIARSLAQGARVLLLDEPTSALDPEMRREVRDVLRDVARAGDHEGRPLTILLVTHDLPLFTELSTRVWRMERGRITQRGTPQEVGLQ